MLRTWRPSASALGAVAKTASATAASVRLGPQTAFLRTAINDESFIRGALQQIHSHNMTLYDIHEQTEMSQRVTVSWSLSTRNRRLSLNGTQDDSQRAKPA